MLEVVILNKLQEVFHRKLKWSWLEKSRDFVFNSRSGKRQELSYRLAASLYIEYLQLRCYLVTMITQTVEMLFLCLPRALRKKYVPRLYQATMIHNSFLYILIIIHYWAGQVHQDPFLFYYLIWNGWMVVVLNDEPYYLSGEHATTKYIIRSKISDAYL